MELQFAKSKGYQIKVTKGYQFNKEFNVFDNYVDELSREKDIQKGSKRQVIKNLLNNLLGRFGLNFVKPITKTLHKSALDIVLATRVVKNLKRINDNNFIVTYLPLVDNLICESHNLDYYKIILNKKQKNITGNINVFQDTSIIISAFVSAYARIHMHQVKLDILVSGGSIYYSDTDSIVTDLSLGRIKEIMPEKVGDKLGQLKFELLAEEAFFISNKTYAIKEAILSNKDVEKGAQSKEDVKPQQATSTLEASLLNSKPDFISYSDRFSDLGTADFGVIQILKAEELGSKYIKKGKGFLANNTSYSDYQSMYLHSKSIQGDKTSSTINYSKGSVSINSSKISIN